MALSVKLQGIESVSGGMTKLPVAGVMAKYRYEGDRRTEDFLGTAVTVAMPRKCFATATILVKGKTLDIKQEGVEAACMEDSPILAEFRGVEMEIGTDFRTKALAIKGNASDVDFTRPTPKATPAPPQTAVSK